MTYLYKKRGFWEVLERIRALYANKDEYSYIRVAFRKLRSEKNVQMIVFKNLYRIYNFHIILAQESSSVYTKFFQSINMNNVKNTMKRKILFMTESKKFALMKNYLLRR